MSVFQSNKCILSQCFAPSMPQICFLSPLVFPVCSNCFQTEQSVFTGLNTQESGSPPSWPPSQSFWSPDMSVRVISPNFISVLHASQGAQWGWQICTCRCIHSQSCSSYPIVFLHTPTQAVICKRSMGERGALRWKNYFRTKYECMSRWMFSGQVLDWQAHIKGRGLAAAVEARETPQWKDRRRSESWAAEQHLQGVKKPITVNQTSAARQGGKERKLYPGSGPPELACRVQHRGKSTGCHIHLDFYECFDSSPKDTPMTRWRVFIQACQTSKKWGGGIFANPLCSQRKKNLLF